MPTRSDSTRRIRRQRAVTLPDRFSEPGLEPHYPPDLELEPFHIDLDLHVDLVRRRVAGTVTHSVRARRPGPTVLRLDAISFTDVAVRDVDGQALAWDYDGRRLTITWRTPFAAAEERRVEIAYAVTNPASGLYFSAPDDAYPDQAWYAASDHETERARHWLPCLDLPNVRTTLTCRLRAESRFTILSNGLLEKEETHDDGSKTAFWRLDQPCPSYLICIAIGDFVRADDGVVVTGDRQVALATFCTREHSAADLQRTFGRTRAMMGWMAERLAMPFPYPKYYQFALPDFGGAMENISLVGWSDAYVQDETLAHELGWLVDQINVHEMAHSYFGDAIVCRDFAHAWLKESWATYMEQVYRQDNGAPAEAAYVHYEQRVAYLEEADEKYQRPLVTRRFKSSWDLYDGHLYEGGACRLHTLCHELGAETFWTAVRLYLQRYNGRVVETADFRAVLEEVSGRSLGRFFDQWFYQPGYPDIKVTFEYDETRRQGTFTVVQQQAEAAGHAFTLRTDLGWTVDGETRRLPVELTAARHSFVVEMPATPDMVRFDPGHRILHKLTFDPGDRRLRRQLTAAPDIIGRIQAARALAQSSRRLNLQAVVEAYPREPFWGVRREMARALGEANHEEAVAGLARLLAWEQDPMALSQLIRAAGQYRDGRIGQALLERLQAGLPTVATQAAYEALGAQRAHAPVALLSAALDRPGFNGVAQRGAAAGLGQSRQDQAAALLLDRVAYGTLSNRVRPAVARALGQLGRGLEPRRRRDEITERLIDLLRDPWLDVRWAAARGLQSMKDPAAVAPLAAFGRSLSHQENVAVERMVAAIRQEDKLDGSALKKQVDELQDKVRRLEHRLQDVAALVEPQEGER